MIAAVMKRATVGELDRRISRLETGRSSGPLTKAEARELAELEADFDRQFPDVRQDSAAIAELSDEQIEAYLQHERGHDGRAQRMYELHQRARTPEQIEADRIHGEMIDAMNDAELEKWINARIHGPKGPPSWNR